MPSLAAAGRGRSHYGEHDQWTAPTYGMAVPAPWRSVLVVEK